MEGPWARGLVVGRFKPAQIRVDLMKAAPLAGQEMRILRDGSGKEKTKQMNEVAGSNR